MPLVCLPKVFTNGFLVKHLKCFGIRPASWFDTSTKFKLLSLAFDETADLLPLKH